MGRLPIYEPNPVEYPPETHEDGCPGAWYRCRFILSLLRYERPWGDGRAASENINLTRCTDPLVIDAIHAMETERARAHAHHRAKLR
jgi:hypothetical protein